MSDKPVRHILSMSGGKDSTALAIFMRDRVAGMEYVFCDTGKELPETYEYLEKVEAYLGKRIVRLNSDRDFDHWLQVYNGFLPSPRTRWCTRQLKIIPFERYVGDDPVLSYIGIRADEDREGYISHKPNIKAVYPFKEHGIRKEDVFRILEQSGIGLPKYYEWRTRSGCYFCFFQRKAEWTGLLERHPDLFAKAQAYEKIDPATGDEYTWSQGENLAELAARKEAIDKKHADALRREQASAQRSLADVLSDILDDEDDTAPCLACQL